jgi:hypothetical protein
VRSCRRRMAAPSAPPVAQDAVGGDVADTVGPEARRARGRSTLLLRCNMRRPRRPCSMSVKAAAAAAEGLQQGHAGRDAHCLPLAGWSGGSKGAFLTAACRYGLHAMPR